MSVASPASLALGLALLSACGGVPDHVYTCTVDRDCISADLQPGYCFYDGSTGSYCAIKVFGCPSGYRWSAYALPPLRYTCVKPELTVRDGGAGDGTSAADAGDLRTAD